MLGIKAILLIALVAASFCSVADPDSLIYKILQGFAKQAPELEKQISKPETYPTDEIRKIVGRGFTHYKENAEAVQYSGVDASNLDSWIYSRCDSSSSEVSDQFC